MIEITRRDSRYVYRQNEDDPRRLDWRQNVHGGRWQFLAEFSTESLAKAALLTLERNQASPDAGGEPPK